MLDRPEYVEVSKSRHGRRTVYFRRGKGPRIRLPDDLSSNEFRQAYDAALAGVPVEDVRHMPVTASVLRKQRTEVSLKGAFRASRTRAKDKGVPFDLDFDFILAMAVEQEFRCAITGIEFFAKNDTPSRLHPYTPSIDRIEPKLGYVRDNVRLVVYAVNAMLLDWGEVLFVRVANSYRFWSRTKRRQILPCNERKKPAPYNFYRRINRIEAPTLDDGAVERSAKIRWLKDLQRVRGK